MKIPTGIPCAIFFDLTKSSSAKTAAHPTAWIFALDFCADDESLLTQAEEDKKKIQTKGLVWGCRSSTPRCLNMDLVVAVYDDWGIGADGTQPIALSADRKFFREITKGALVIVGRRTVADFPGGKPLPGRVNVMLTKTVQEQPGFTVVSSPEEALELARHAEKAMVIGGGSIYRQMLPMCERAFVTKVHTRPTSDTFFPNLDEDENWELSEVLQAGVEDGIAYEMCLYTREGTI